MDAPRAPSKANGSPEDFFSTHGGSTERIGMNGTGAGRKEQSAPSLTLIDPRTLQLVPVPEREWIVDQWLPIGHVTLNYADGAIGKTLLAQQLSTACATGRPWLGLAVMRCRVLAMFCEDDEAEIHRRQERINRALGVDFTDLGDLRWTCLVGQDNALVRFDRDGKPILTERYAEIKAAALEFGATLLVLDTAADLFGGNENDRSQVRAFLGFVLNGLARAIGGAVLLNAHPSRSGLKVDGDMDGGSTAWSNTARSRWAMVRPKGDDGETIDPNLRVLTRRKANYAGRDAEIKLRWQEGAFHVLADRTQPGIVGGTIQSAEDVFLELLDRCEESSLRLSPSRTANNWAPVFFAKRPDALGYTKRDFDAAMSALFAQRKIVVEAYGRPGDARQRIVRAPRAENDDAAPEEGRANA